MAYDGMYGELSTRGATNEILNLALKTKDEIEASIAEAQTIEAAAEAALAASLELLNQVGGGGGVPVGAIGFNRVGIYPSAQTNVVGGTDVDESANIQLLVDLVATTGGVAVVKSTLPGNPIYINGFVSVESHDTILRFESPVLLGPQGTIRVNGSFDEFVRGGGSQPKLRANSYTDANGRMVLPLRTGDAANLLVGDKIIVRGDRNNVGKPIQKQTTFIYSIVGDDVTCTDEPDYIFQPTYPDSVWEKSITNGTRIAQVVSAGFTADSAPGAKYVSVSDGSMFSVGELVYISDSRTEVDINPARVYRNAANMEIYKISKIDGNNLYFEASLERSYLVSFNACVSKLKQIKNSGLQIRGLSWAAPQDKRVNALEITYGENCFIECIGQDGTAGRLGHGARLSYCYRSEIRGSTIRGSYGYAGGEGYGASIYYSTFCNIRNSWISQCRHNYLLQTATSCNIIDNISTDDYISGIDAHGVASINCKIDRNRVYRSVNFTPDASNGSGIRIGNTAHVIGDFKMTVSNNTVSGYRTGGTTSAAMDFGASGDKVKFIGNVIDDCEIGIRFFPPNSAATANQTFGSVVINDNDISNCNAAFAITGTTLGAITKLIATNNRVSACNSNYVFSTIGTVILTNNEVLDPVNTGSTYGFSLSGITKLIAHGNDNGLTNRPMLINNCPDGMITNNLFAEVGYSPLVTQTGTNTSTRIYNNGDEVIGGNTTVGTTTTGAAGTSASVTNTGTPQAPILNFTIPKGDTGASGAPGAAGAAATVTVGTTTTGAAGSSASVTNVGTSSAAVLNFVIPRGADGTGGGGTTHRDRKTIAIFGDSVSGNNYSSSTPSRMKNNGYMTWGSILSDHRLYFPRWNFGVGGDDSSEVLARVGDVIAVDPDYCVVETGGVDQATYTTAQTIANLTSIYDQLLAAGIYVIACTVYPVSSPLTITTTNREKMADLNRWIMDQRFVRDKFSVIDVAPYYIDHAVSNGLNSKTIMLGDGQHPAQYGAFTLGKILADKIKELEPETRPYLFSDPSDLYSATNVYGNAVTNGMLLGTGGTNGSGTSGAVAAGWTLAYNPSASGTTAVGSKEVHPVFPDLERQVITLSGTPTANSTITLSQSKSTATSPGSGLLNNLIEAFCEIEIVNGSGMAGVTMDIRTSTNTIIASDAEVWNTTATNAAGLVIPPGSWKGILKTPPVLLPSGATSVSPTVNVTFLKGVAVSGTIKIGRVVFRRASVNIT